MSLKIERYHPEDGWTREPKFVESGTQDLVFVFGDNLNHELPHKILFISGGEDSSRVADINAILVEAEKGTKVFPCNAKALYEIHNGARLTINALGQRIRFTQVDDTDLLFYDGI